MRKETFWKNRYKKEKFVWGKKPTPIAKIVFNKLKNKKSAKLLDIGCGYGRDCIFLAKKGFDVYGIDNNKECIKLAEKWSKEKNLRINFKSNNLLSPKLKNNFFDVIFSYNVLHLLTKAKERKKAVNKIYNLLRKEGLSIQTVFSKQESSKRKLRPTHKYSKKELKKLFKKFKILTIKRVKIYENHGNQGSHFHNDWLIIAKKH